MAELAAEYKLLSPSQQSKQEKTAPAAAPPCTPELIEKGKKLNLALKLRDSGVELGGLGDACIFAAKHSAMTLHLKAIQCYLWDAFRIDLQDDLTWNGGSEYELRQHKQYFMICKKTKLERPNNNKSQVPRTHYNIQIMDSGLTPVLVNGVIVGFEAKREIKLVEVLETRGEVKIPTRIRYRGIYAQTPNNNLLRIGETPSVLGSGNDVIALPSGAAIALDNNGNALSSDLGTLADFFQSNGLTTVLSGTIRWTIDQPTPKIEPTPAPTPAPSPTVEQKNCYNYQISDGAFTYNAAKNQYTAIRSVSRVLVSTIDADADCPPPTINYQNIAASADLKPNEEPKRIGAPTGSGTELPIEAKQHDDFSITKIENKFDGSDGYTTTLVWELKEKFERIPICYNVYADDRNAPSQRAIDNTNQINDIVKWLKDNSNKGIVYCLSAFGVDSEPEYAQADTGANLDSVVVDSSEGITYRMRAQARIDQTRSDIFAAAKKQGVPIDDSRVKFTMPPIVRNHASTATSFDWKK